MHIYILVIRRDGQSKPWAHRRFGLREALGEEKMHIADGLNVIVWV